MEDRKLKEVEHSRKRREVLQGYERLIDSHAVSNGGGLDVLIKDKEKFNYYFSNMKFYSVTKSSEAYKEKLINKFVNKGDRVLDFACGSGENGIFAAKQGAFVTGIDISPEGIENSKENAKREGLNGQCEYFVMDGENMTFENNTFDFAVEYGALHHVDLDNALSEIARVLKPNAKMVCVEALRHNPLIHNYRKRTPHLRTEWEVDHILGVESFKYMKKYFEHVNVKYFHFFSLILVPFRKTILFRLLYPFLDWIDSLFLKLPFIGRYAWIMVLELGNPKKEKI